MNEILQAIRDYVRTPQTDYALLITGPWGCGKTYFWKNVVEPELKKLTRDGATWRPLYASLYGCQRTKDIDTQLFLASHPHLKKKWVTRLTTVGGSALNRILKAFTRFELPAVDLRWLVNTKDAVLCFDDLERTRLPMKEALGYINTFVEHEHVKTIILCNESEIGPKAEKTTYDAMKEKVVGASLTFQPDLDEVFRTLIDEYGSRARFHEFLSQNAALLRHLFDRSETQNIRALRRALSALAVIFDALDANKIDSNAIAKQLIYIVAPAAFELHGRATAPDNLRKVLCADNMAIAGWVAKSRMKNEDAKSSEHAFRAEFAERYFEGIGLAEWKTPVGCPPICEFLITGVLDRTALKSWAEELTKPVDEREQRVRCIVQGFWWDMEDDEFTNAVKRTLSEVEQGDVTNLGEYVALFKAYESLHDHGLITIPLDDLFSKFVRGLRKARREGRLKAAPIPYSALEHPALRPEADRQRRLYEFVRRVNRKLWRKAIRTTVEAVLSRRVDEPERLIEALTESGANGLLGVPVFCELAANEWRTWTCTLSNHLKDALWLSLRGRYSPSTNPLLENLVDELPTLKEFRDALDQYFKANHNPPLPVSLLMVKEIIKTLDSAIKQLECIRRSRGQPLEPPTVDLVERPPESQKDRHVEDTDSA